LELLFLSGRASAFFRQADRIAPGPVGLMIGVPGEADGSGQEEGAHSKSGPAENKVALAP
jgi:hypothetical protein